MLLSELLKEQEEKFETKNSYSDYQIKCISLIKDAISTLKDIDDYQGKYYDFSFIDILKADSNYLVSKGFNDEVYETFKEQYDKNHKILIYCEDKTLYRVASRLTRFDAWKSYRKLFYNKNLHCMGLNPKYEDNAEPEILLVDSTYINVDFSIEINSVLKKYGINFNCKIIGKGGKQYFYLPNEKEFSLPFVNLQMEFEKEDDSIELI